MDASAHDWQGFFQYHTDDSDRKVDGYWLFAPMLSGDIELFRIGVMVKGTQVQRCGASIVKAGEVRLFAPGEPQITRGGDGFRFQVGSLTLTSDDPDRVFRIQARDDEQRLAADLVVRPATPVVWDVGGSAFYGTTLDSTLEGTITIDGETTSVSTLCAFEHMRAAESEGKPTEGGWPAFWHYEYVQWADGGAGAPNGSILWHRTDEHDVLDATAGLHVSDGEGGAIAYDSYELDYKDVEDHDGRPLPGSWEVPRDTGGRDLHLPGERPADRHLATQWCAGPQRAAARLRRSPPGARGCDDAARPGSRRVPRRLVQPLRIGRVRLSFRARLLALQQVVRPFGA